MSTTGPTPSTDFIRTVILEDLKTNKYGGRVNTRFPRRQFQAETAIKYCRGNPRRAEQVFGWGRDAVNIRDSIAI
jgi:hypothetical protein